MRIVIDLQGAQTESRFRGIGRYTLSIAKSIAAQKNEHDIIVLLNAAFADTLAPLRHAFEPLIGHERIMVWHGPAQTRSMDPENQWRSTAACLIREAFIAALEPDVVFIPGFFEGYVDDASVSIGAFATLPSVVTLHDLIPLYNPAQYLDHDPRYKQFYLQKIDGLKLAAGLAAVSHSAAEEAVALLGYDQSHIVTTSEAADEVFQPLDLTLVERQRLRARLAISRQFVLYTGGADPRKNLARLVEAFASLPDDVRGAHQLVISGKMSDGDRAPLELAATRHGMARTDLVFLGYVSDADLARLYNDCALYVMPSLHEGFGLPALEAMQCGAPTIGANASSLPEVIGSPEAMFDPLSVPAITEKLLQALTDPEFSARLKTHGLERAKKFSWASSGAATLQALELFGTATAPLRDWAQWQTWMNSEQRRLLTAIIAGAGRPTEKDLAEVAQAIGYNRRNLDAINRQRELPMSATWQIEGPFDSSYSLAGVNREMARALQVEGATVVLRSSEGTGDTNPNPKFLRTNPDIAALHDQAHPAASADIISRNMYPPRVSDMTGRLNMLHNYAWEETGFPQEWAEEFNDYLQGLTVTSHHVKKLLIDNGVSVPIAVVGNGVDHWQKLTADTGYALKAKSFRFLHVSSCFPRKGADVLIEAYAEAFTADDDVSLIIKTFANPHNTIRQQLADLKRRFPKLGDIVIIEDDLSEQKLKALYEQCHVLVAPSRAEGFGLPLAEAILSSLPVIATGWSGQLDFLGDDPLSLIDYSFAKADSHIGIFDSVWAEPSRADLVSRLKAAVTEDPASRAARIAALQTRLNEQFSWQTVAERNTLAASQFSRNTVGREPVIGWVSTYGIACGIATYTHHLLDGMGEPVQVFATIDGTANPALDPLNVNRCWTQGQSDDLSALTAAVLASDVDVLVVQFNYGFFEFAALSRFLNAITTSGRRVVVTLHSTRDPANAPQKRLVNLIDALSFCDRVLVHAIADLNRLKDLGLTENVSLFPHGVLDPSTTTAPRSLSRVPTIASYGFFLPNKGLPELIEAFALLRQNGSAGRLLMVNSQFPAPISSVMIEDARAQITRLGLSQFVDLHTDFLEDDASLALLSRASVIVYPYQQTGESASGAVRYGLASGIPVAVTPLPIFDDIADASFVLPGITPTDIAKGLETIFAQIAKPDAAFTQIMTASENWRASHTYSRLGRRLIGILRALHNDDGALDFID